MELSVKGTTAYIKYVSNYRLKLSAHENFWNTVHIWVMKDWSGIFIPGQRFSLTFPLTM